MVNPLYVHIQLTTSLGSELYSIAVAPRVLRTWPDMCSLNMYRYIVIASIENKAKEKC